MKFRWHRVVSEFPAALASSNSTIDLVSIGSSRMMRAIDAYGIQDAVQQRLDRDVIVYDLSKPYRGPEVEYLFLRDALSRRPIKTMLIEYNRGSNNLSQHRNLMLIGHFRDIPFLYWNRPGLHLDERLQLTCRFILRKIAETLIMAGTGKLRTILKEAKTQSNSFDPSPPKSQISLDGFKVVADWHESPNPGWDFDDLDTAMDSYMVREVVRMGRAAGTRTVFFHVPRVYQSTLDERFLTRFKAHFGAVLITLPVELLTQIYPGSYADSSHMNPHGAALVSNWIAQQDVLWDDGGEIN